MTHSTLSDDHYLEIITAKLLAQLEWSKSSAHSAKATGGTPTSTNQNHLPKLDHNVVALLLLHSTNQHIVDASTANSSQSCPVCLSAPTRPYLVGHPARVDDIRIALEHDFRRTFQQEQNVSTA
ncbi:hypothetical protein V6N13_042541 [Hibiscus sabdariffa]